MEAGSEYERRAIAKVASMDYEGMLMSGQAIIDGKDLAKAEDEEWRGLIPDTLRESGFLPVPFSDNMRLAAGQGGTIPIGEDAESSPVVVYGPSLRRASARHLRAFRAGGDSMEPIIAHGGLVVADLAGTNANRLKEGGIYIICVDLATGECAVKYLAWARRGGRRS